MTDIYTFLHNLAIPFKKYEHEAVFTVEEAEKIDHELPCAASKNLFLCDKKQARFYLVVTQAKKRVDLKKLQEVLHEGRLSFASAELLKKYLGVNPGSVSPFALINDTKHVVTAIIDTDLLAENEKQGFHPNENTATLVLATKDFTSYLENTGNAIMKIQV